MWKVPFGDRADNNSQSRIEVKTIETQIPEPVFKQAQELALRENVSLEQIITLAVTQTIGVWSNGTVPVPFQHETSASFPAENTIAVENRRAGREKFLDAITGMLHRQAALQEEN